MAAAHEQRLESRKRRSRFVTQAQLVGHKMSGKRKQQWDVITSRIADCGALSGLSFYDDERPKYTAEFWKKQCQAVGIGTGLLSWFFWNFFLPHLIELAKQWIESNRNQESDSDR